MSAFEVSLTPTGVKKKPLRNENREPVSVIMAPFSAKSIVVFEDVPVTKTARRTLIVTNPTDAQLEVILSKGLKSDLNITLEWEAQVIPPQGSVNMEIVWSPLKLIACSESIQFIDNRNFRKDVSVILKSIVKFSGPKNSGRFPNISNGVSKHPPKMTKSATSHTITAPKHKVQPLANISKSEMNISKIHNQNAQSVPRHNDFLDKLDAMSPLMSAAVVPDSVIGKENVSPETPKNASDLFDKFKFTPATETKTKQTSNIEILSSMPTPVLKKKSEPKVLVVDGVDNACEMNRKRLMDVTPESATQEKQQRQGTPKKSPRWIPKIVRHSCTPPSDEKSMRVSVPSKFDPHIVSTVTKRTTPERVVPAMSPSNSNEGKRKLFVSQPSRQITINKTFELGNESISRVDSGEALCEEGAIVEPVMNKTTTIISTQARILSIIDEEEKPESLKTEINPTQYFQKMYDYPDEHLLRDVQLVGTPLRKVSESMKDLSSKKLKIATQGSMPNLNEMEAIKSIEQNRYYLQVKLEADDSSDALDVSSTSTRSTAISVQELYFDQHEILAQSSRFNINDPIKKENFASPSELSKSPTTELHTPTEELLTPEMEMIVKLPVSEVIKSAADSQSAKRFNFTKRTREQSVDITAASNFLGVDAYNNGTAYSVSPPKKTKYDNSNANVKPGTKIRVTKWSATQPKKLKLIRPNAAKTPLTPRKIKIEPGVKLYDSDMYLQPFINPDPFAATTTFDPFLASTMYLDESAIKRHEQQLMKWLNALVTIPAELDADCSKKIDVGNLFNVVRNQELMLAPTKEEQSMNYLTKSKMEALRKAAVNLYMSQEMLEICSKVAVHISKHSVEVRKDRDLHLDVVLQRYILELLLSFNPLWLRLGLEVVFGEIIHLHSNSDIVGLSTFILNRLFRDRLLEQKNSKAYYLSEQYASHIKKFMLQKFLLLLLFLDKAKNKKIIKHNPCLFTPNSKYKETKEILLRFSSELLSNVGDITRNLKRLGYALIHKQTYIDEFNYAFKNLAIDLRDGVRLTRVMEIILLRDDLTTQLRVPAISRTQKAYNVNLALKALADANFTLTGGICAYDIVDGHREKTLSLLWQIIYKFRSPKFHAAATVIQKWWHRCWLRVVINRRIRIKIEIRQNEAARTIQSAYRGYISRKRTEVWRKERVAATISIQRFVRGFLTRKRFQRIVTNIVFIQRWYRATHLSRIERTSYLSLKTAVIQVQRWFRRILLSRKLASAALIIKEIKLQAKHDYNNAVVIQRAWKSIIIRRKFQTIIHQVVYRIRTEKTEYKSAARIQSFFQMIRLRREFIIKKSCTIRIQRTWRLYKLTITIRKVFLQQRAAAIQIQKYFRSYKAMKAQREEYQTIRSSAIKIQRRYRETQLAKHERRTFLQLRSSVISIQRRYRATQLMKKQRNDYLQTKNAARVIQIRFRAQMQMKKQRNDYIKLKTSAVKIQQKLRATLFARKVRLNFLSQQYYSIILQQRFRANRLMKKEAYEYRSLKIATIKIQQQYRAQVYMRMDRQKFLAMKNAAIVFQNRFRAQLAMRKYRQSFMTLRLNTIILQRRFRALMLMRKQRAEYLNMRRVVINVQRRFCANRLMRTHRSMYLKLKHAATILQARYRAQISMRTCRQSYLSLKLAMINIQHQFRATQLMKKERNDYIRLKNAAICIQRRYRANKLMRLNRSEYQRTKSIAITIQRRYRANKAMKLQRAEFISLKQAAIVIQSRFRAHKAMQSSFSQFINLKSKTILIQRFVRSYFLMKHSRRQYLIQRNAIINIQEWWRRTLIQRRERQLYIRTIAAVKIIQNRWRATCLMRKTKLEYFQYRNKVIVIQQKFRSYLIMKTERQNYLVQKQSAIIIQRKFRAQKNMQKTRQLFLQTKKSVIKIQQWYRAIRLGRKIRQDYVNLRRSVIFVQQKFRARKLAQTQQAAYRQIKNVTMNLQCRIRGMLARKRFNELLTPERRELIRRRKAVKIIQRYWRGYAIRKRWQSVEFQVMRNRIKEARANFKPANAIRNLVLTSVQRLKQRYQVTELLSILIRLENLSRVVPHTLKEPAAFVASFSYGIMAQANRSEPDKQVIELCSRIILNFARYSETKEAVFQESGLVTIAQMLLRWSDKDCPIFNTLCTLVWVFIHSEEKKKVIYNFMTTREAMFFIRETKKLVLRKEKMRSRSRKPNNSHQSDLNTPKAWRRKLPHLETDFGVVKKAPYIFNCSIFALDTILSILEIAV